MPLRKLSSAKKRAGSHEDDSLSNKLHNHSQSRKSTPSAIHDGAHAAHVSSLGVGSPLLPLAVGFFTAMTVHRHWQSAPPLAHQAAALVDITYEASHPPPPPVIRWTGPCKPRMLSAKRWVKLAWLAETHGWEYTNSSEASGTLDADFGAARLAILSKIRGQDFRNNIAALSVEEQEKAFNKEYTKAVKAFKARKNPDARRHYSVEELRVIAEGNLPEGRTPNAVRQKRADLAVPKPPFPAAIFDASLPPLQLTYHAWTPLDQQRSIPPEAEVDWSMACARIPEQWPLDLGSADFDLRDRLGERLQVCASAC